MKRSLLMPTYAAALLTAATSYNSNDSMKRTQAINEAKTDNTKASTDMGKIEKKV